MAQRCGGCCRECLSRDTCSSACRFVVAERPPKEPESAVPRNPAADDPRLKNMTPKFCERVKALREATGLTRKEFAESIGEYPGTYSAWENNSLAGAGSLPKLALTLGTTKKLESIMNKTVKKVSQDIEDMKFNTAIAAMMTCLNEINDVGTLTKDELSVFIRLLCPFAPHLCEEMWEQLGEDGLCSTAKWPDYDESKCVDDEIEIAVQVNGRVRDRFTVPADIEAADAIARAKELDKVREFTDGMAFIKELYVPGKLVNLVVKPQ